MRKILIVDDELGVRDSLRMIFKKDYTVVTAGSAKEAWEKIASEEPDLIFLDIIMPQKDGMEMLKEVRESHPMTPVVMLTATKTVKTAVDAMKLGAHDYVTKPFDVEELKIIADKALENRDLKADNRRLQTEVEERYRFDNIIGKSKGMRDIYGIIRQIAERNSTVLIHGESGTGKELVARAIHYNSQRKDKPFVAVNCAAIPETLIESELFGHEKGAFTDAQNRRIGHFELAHLGTLFMDEVSELSLPTQAKILRALQEREFVRVGGGKTISGGCAPHFGDEQEPGGDDEPGNLSLGPFLPDQCRPPDDPPVAPEKGGHPPPGPAFPGKARRPGSEENLPRGDGYPGRLRLAGKRAGAGKYYRADCRAELCGNREAGRTPLDPEEHFQGGADQAGGAQRTVSFDDAERDFEKDIIVEALKKTNFIQTKAADLMGISRRILKYKMDKYGIPASPDDGSSPPAAGNGNEEP